jgi:hypothetical protein
VVKDIVPEEVWTEEKVNLSHLKIFGCKSFYMFLRRIAKSGIPRTKNICVGYSEESKGFMPH